MISINATLVVQLLHFLLLVFIMNYLFIRPVKRIIAEREAHFSAGRAETERLLEQSARGESDHERKMLEVAAQGRIRKADVSQAASAEYRAVVTETEKKARVMLDEVRRDAEMQVAKARRELSDQIDVLARQMVERVLGRPVDASRGGNGGGS